MQRLGSIAGETLSSLIGSIYDCAIDAGHWPETLTRLHQALDFKNAVMNLMALPSGETHLNIISGIEPPWIDRMLRAGPEVVEQWGGAERIQSFPLHEPAVLSRVNDRANWADNRYYTEWAKPQGIIDVMGIGLARDAELVGTIGLGRHESAGEIGDREIEAMRLLIPHLQRAVAIGKLLELKSLAAETHKAALNTIMAGVVLVDADCRIVHANQAAQAMLGAGEPIFAAGGRLGVRSALAMAALRPAVRQASENEAAIGRRGFGIPLVLADGKPCVLHVLPLQYGTIRPGVSPDAAAAVFIASTSLRVPPSSELLATLFDLTAAESRVFSRIAGGMTPKEAATDLGIATSTTKTHLVRVFLKTGTHRQADLVRLAASLGMDL